VGATSSNWFEVSGLNMISNAVTVQSGVESVPEPTELGITGLALLGLSHAARRGRWMRAARKAIASDRA
jgi:hypothetical protein